MSLVVMAKAPCWRGWSWAGASAGTSPKAMTDTRASNATLTRFMNSSWLSLRSTQDAQKVQMRGGARRPHARRTLCTLSVRRRAPTKQMGLFQHPGWLSSEAAGDRVQIGHVAGRSAQHRRLRDSERGGRGLILGDLRHHGLAGAVERLAVVDDEFSRLAQTGEIAVDFRHHVARHPVPAWHRFFRVGPGVDEADDGAKTAGDVEDGFDSFHEIVRGANGGGGTGDERGLVHGLIGALVGTRAGPLQGRGDVFVMMPH